MALMETGFGNVDRNAMDELATGRKFALDFKLDDTAFEFDADTRPADLKDQLYLFAAKLGQPRWDPNPIVRAVAAARLQWAASASSPQAALQRDIGYLLKDRDPRYKMPDPAALDTVTPQDFRRVWEPLLAQGPIEVDLFGDFKREDGLAALEATFGALAPRAPVATPPLNAHLPAPSQTPLVLTHTGDADTAAAMVVWPTGGGRAGVHESRQLEILAQIANNRLFDEMREKIGASYAPQVDRSGRWTCLRVATWARPSSCAPATFRPSLPPPTRSPPIWPRAPHERRDRARDRTAQAIDYAGEHGQCLLHVAAGRGRARTGQVRRHPLDPGRLQPHYPQAMQALAARYLRQDRAWRVEVVPAAKGATRVESPAMCR
jgi:zinc protease